MEATLYAVPVGMMGDSLMTTIECCVPELLLIMTPGNSFVVDSQEELDEKYSELQPIAEFDIDDEQKLLFDDLKAKVEEKDKSEEGLFIKLEDVITDAVEKFKTSPQIHMPTADEISQISVDDDKPGSGLVLDY